MKYTHNSHGPTLTYYSKGAEIKFWNFDNFVLAYSYYKIEYFRSIPNDSLILCCEFIIKFSEKGMIFLSLREKAIFACYLYLQVKHDVTTAW